VGVRAAEVPVERELEARRGGVRGRERRAEDRVRAERVLVGGAVEIDQRAVDLALVERLEPDERLGDRSAHVRDRAEHALAPITLLFAVTELARLVLPRRGAARDRRPTDRPVVEHDVDLDRGVAAGIEDLARVDLGDRAHRRPMVPEVGRRTRQRSLTGRSFRRVVS
jgi:hypothetical protein